ncbi:tyrosine-type recombinase/integrase [Litorilituus sediminis]|uniref:Site-specific integrase n=1 Tax=Litorilituus sediminis TaxID=718192 RepID=A0A4P6P067_9GAMM|nr:site-specific integrase [Litorilituus sediminis]QBG34376.1 site-specific integrase [Litorilituus sediminis]
MASVRVLKSGSINVQVRLSGQKPISKTFPKNTSQSVIDDWIESKEFIRLNESKYNQLTLSGLIDEYIERVMTGRSGEVAARDRAKQLLKYYKNTIPQSAAEVNGYKWYRLDLGRANSTVRGEIELLGRVLRFAIKELSLNIIDATEGVSKPPPSKGRDSIVNEKQMLKIANAMPTGKGELVKVYFYTAMRRSELVKIELSDVDLKNRTVLLRETKNGEDRLCPLSSQALDIITARYNYCKAKGQQRLYPYKKESITQAFKRTIRKLNMDESLVLHSLRHSAATRYAELGLTTLQLSAVTGHKSLSQLARYTHLNAKSVVDLLG